MSKHSKLKTRTLLMIAGDYAKAMSHLEICGDDEAYSINRDELIQQVDDMELLLKTCKREVKESDTCILFKPPTN